MKGNPSLFYHHIGEIYHRSSEIGPEKSGDWAESAGNPSGDGMTYKKKLTKSLEMLSETLLPIWPAGKSSSNRQLIPLNRKPGGQIYRQSVDKTQGSIDGEETNAPE